jgi:thiamine biosynthesis lipoprotein
MEIGGEMRGRGVRPDGQPWMVELDLSDIAAAPGEPACTRVALIDAALATSGDFVRRRGQISHLIDGRTGKPLDGRLSGVAVLAKTCIDADGWATALFALGEVDGMALAEREELAVVFATRTPDGARATLSSKAQAMAD